MLLLLLSFSAFATPARDAAAPGAARSERPVGSVVVDNVFEGHVKVAANREGVPVEILLALAFEASRFNADVQSEWGGYGLFGLREGEQDPSLEHGAALLSVDPELVIADWRLSVDAAAAILADQARSVNRGVLPDRRDLLLWWNAVRAFSGRDEPFLQEQFALYIFQTIEAGFRVDTTWGEVALHPRTLDLSSWEAVPPPGLDTSLAYQFYAASTCNYSDYSRGSGDIDMVVIHTVEGSYSGCYSWFANCSAQASAQYVVRSSDGQITQMVEEGDVAWHAGDWTTNLRSVGIEHEGYVSDPGTWYTDAMYAASAALTVDIAARQGISLDRSHIIGHYEVPGCSGSGGGAGCHTDPGTGWDWDYYMALLNGETGTTDGTLYGVIADSDIYNGSRLAGATVWLGETGASTTTDGSGVYAFADLPFGSYTVHAVAAGFAEGTCAKTTTGSEEWCSIALYPDDGGGDTEAEDTGVDEETADDSAAPTEDDMPDLEPTGTVVDGPRTPGALVGMDETGAGCSSTGGRGLLGALFGIALAKGRRGRKTPG